MTTLYFKMTDENGDVWYASSMLVRSTPQAQLGAVRAKAVKKGIKTTYDLATKEAYLAYRESTRAAIAQATGAA